MCIKLISEINTLLSEPLTEFAVIISDVALGSVLKSVSIITFKSEFVISTLPRLIAVAPIIPSAKSIVPPLATKLLLLEISPLFLIFNVDPFESSIELLAVVLFKVTSF